MMKQTGTVWGMSHGKLNSALTKLWNELDDEGARVLTQVADDDAFRQQLVQFAVSGGIQTTTDQRIVQLLMGDGNTFLPRDWTTHYAKFGVKFSKTKLRQVAKFPWDEDVLKSPCPFHPKKKVWETHFAFLGLDKVERQPLSINHLQEWHPASGQPRFYNYGNDCWYGNAEGQIEQLFAKNVTCEPRWHLMLKEIVPKSTSTSFDQQKAMLPAEYEVPTAVAEVTKHMLFGAKNAGYYLNEGVYARCQDLSADRCRVYVGYSDHDRLDVNCWFDDAISNIGVGAARKLPE